MKTEPKTEKLITKTHKNKTVFSSISKKYRSFNRLFLGTVLLSILGVGGLNIWLDPYGVFKTHKVQGLNQDKPRQRDNDRIFKTTDIIYTKPKTIIIGSSRVRQGIDPNHPALRDTPVYNLGLNGTNAYEELRYLQHAIANQKDLKAVVLEIDLFMFNKLKEPSPAFDEQRLEKQHMTFKDFINVVSSWNALQSSYETLVSSYKSRNNGVVANYGEGGYMPYRNVNNRDTQWRFNYSINQYLELHHKYELSDQYMNDFKQLVELCRQKGIDLKIFISPAHATQGEVIRMTGYEQVYEDWKRQIVNITPVWDFSGYNSITTAKINDKMEKYVDNSHFMPFIGAFILDRLFSYQTDKVPQDFGVWLTPDNVEAHIQKTRTERDQWAQQHPDEIAFVKKVKDEFDKQKAPSKSD